MLSQVSVSVFNKATDVEWEYFVLKQSFKFDENN